MAPEQRDELREQAAGDDVILRLLERYAPFSWRACWCWIDGGSDGE